MSTRQKFFWSLITILIFALTLVGCEESRVENLQKRLDAFRNILPQELRAEFDNKNYDKVVFGIDSLLGVDEGFKDNYEKLKDQEAINVFSPQDVVDFFKTYFVEEIEKEKM